MSVSSEYYINLQICKSGTNNSLNSSTFNSSYSYSSSYKKTLLEAERLNRRQDDECYDSFCGSPGILDAFCYIGYDQQNQISSILGCFVAGIAFITIALSVASFPINAIYILALFINKSKKWKKGLWLFGIAFGLIFVSTILFAFSAFITSFISPY